MSITLLNAESLTHTQTYRLHTTVSIGLRYFIYNSECRCIAIVWHSLIYYRVSRKSGTLLCIACRASLGGPTFLCHPVLYVIIIVMLISQLCLCCCGICRPKTTASTLAFWPPKPSTYWFDYEGDPDADDSIARIRFSSPVFCGGIPQELFELQVSGFEVNTSGGNRIACAYVRCCIKPKFTVLFSHVNASDLGLEIPMILSLRFLAELCQCDYLCYDYSGYGISSGALTWFFNSFYWTLL